MLYAMLTCTKLYFSIYSGGTQFRVFGERLDVVQSPQILFTISSSSLRRRQTEIVCMLQEQLNCERLPNDDICTHCRRNIMLLVEL